MSVGRTLMYGVAVTAASLAAPSTLAQIIAVDSGGNVAGGNRNSGLDNGAELQVEFVDVDGDTVTDARTFIPIDHTGTFLGPGALELADAGGFTSTWRAGMQVVNYGTTTPTTVGLFRLGGNSATNDAVQMSTQTNAGTGATSQGAAFAPHVAKTNFLNGLGGATELSFTDAADAFSLSFGNQNTGPDRRARLLVQNGTDWYISDTASGSSSGTISVNPFTETWFPYDPSTDFFYDEVGGGDLSPVGVGVSGAAFSDIQSLGALLTKNGYDGSSPNQFLASVNNLEVSLDAMFPDPPTPQPGFAVVDWDMDTVTPGVTTTDKFNLVFTGEAVIDASGTPNPGLIAGEMNDPLFLGDVTPGGALGPIPASTMPTQTVGGLGFGGGEALSFDGVDDEAIGIIAWLADTNESDFIPGLDGVYVEVDFKEDDNTSGGFQRIISARNQWELRIDDAGNLEWSTSLEGGGNDVIEVALGAEGDWREVQAYHNADGTKGLILDGVQVAESFTGAALKIDRQSIVLGNRENSSSYYAGLIDNVFVGSGFLEALITGDFNGDGFVSQADLDLVLLNWGDGVLPGGFDEAALSSGGPFDGLISQNELDDVLLNWGNGTPPSVNAIPEPTSLALVGLGGALMLRRRSA